MLPSTITNLEAGDGMGLVEDEGKAEGGADLGERRDFGTDTWRLDRTVRKDLPPAVAANRHTDAILHLLKPYTQPKINREKLYYLNNLLSEWQSKRRKPFSLESWSSASTLAWELDKILGDLERDTNQVDHENQPPTQSNGETCSDDIQLSEAAYRWSNQFVDEKSIRGIKNKEVFFRRLILPQSLEGDDTHFRSFGLVGMGGIGKTTLAQMVFNHPDVRSPFLPRIWVCLSKQPGDDSDLKKEIVKRILRSLGVEDDIINYANAKHGLKGLLYFLRQQLSGKRYLIVLDDIWVEDEGYFNFVSDLEKNITKCEEKLAYGLPKDCGGAIIVTSRSKKIAAKLVGEENLHRVLPLSDEDCWQIFKYTYEEEGNTMSSDMESLKDKICEKCCGLPLAAKMMGENARKPKPPQDPMHQFENFFPINYMNTDD